MVTSLHPMANSFGVLFEVAVAAAGRIEVVAERIVVAAGRIAAGAVVAEAVF